MYIYKLFVLFGDNSNVKRKLEMILLENIKLPLN